MLRWFGRVLVTCTALGGVGCGSAELGGCPEP